MINNNMNEYQVEIGEEVYNVSISKDGKTAIVDGETINLDITLESPPNHYSMLLDGKTFAFTIRDSNDNRQGQYNLNSSGFDFEANVISARESYLKEFVKSATVSKSESKILAPMPGLIVRVEVEIGANISKGQSLIVMEAMKMENDIKAIKSGIIKEILVTEKDAVEKNQPLIIIE